MTAIFRRKFLTSAGSLPFVEMLSSPVADAAHPDLTVGAIRWDPWYIQSDTAERPSMEASLDPSRWQGRAPACATITSNNGISFAACNSQTQMDAEISAAHAANLDYWAYCWYGPTDPMQEAWHLHQKSQIRDHVNWCMLLYYKTVATVTSNDESLKEYVTFLKQSNYQKVLKTRPLLYLLKDKTDPTSLTTSINVLRRACHKDGLGNPYVVLLVGAVDGAVSAVGADAIGIYSVSFTVNAASYDVLTESVKSYWTALAATRQSIVPTAMTGWDRRPRVEHPVPWERAMQHPGEGWNNYYEAGTPAQIASHVGDMVSWLKTNKAVCPAQTGLIYSWDEHDEGGSTLNRTLRGGDEILRAVGRVL